MKACVVGLGVETLHILQQVGKTFAHYGAAHQLASIWITPEPIVPKDAGIENITIAIDQGAAFRELYFRDERVRAWSGANWVNWQEALFSTRLYGKLAVYHHLPTLYERILNILGQLGTGDGEIALYLVAHLHDPFASGALIDLAYLLHDKLALPRGFKLYGMLLLPGMAGDSILEQGESTPRDWGKACAYAALRDLNFLFGERSFYDNYHSHLPIKAKDQSPFQQGDCYILGGTQNELQQTLTYDDALKNIAQCVYLQTQTAMSEYFSESEKNKGLFSTFGMLIKQQRPDELVSQAEEQEQLAAALMERILERTDEVLRFDAQDILSPPLEVILNQEEGFAQFQSVVAHLDSGSTPTNTLTMRGTRGRTSRSSQRRFVEERDETPVTLAEQQYRSALRILIELESELGEAVTERLTRTQNSVLTQFRAFFEQPALNLAALQTALTDLREALESNYKRTNNEMEQLQQEAQRAAASMAFYREAYEYVGAEKRIRELMLTTLLPISVMGTLLILISGQLVLALVWMTCVTVIPILTAYTYRKRRRTSTARTFHEAQRDLLMLQLSLMKKRSLAAYYHLASEWFKTQFRMDDPARMSIATLRRQIGALARSKPEAPNDFLVYLLPRWRDILPKLLWSLWEKELSDQDLYTEILVHVRENQLRSSEQRQEQGCRDTSYALQANTAALLAINRELLPESSREDEQGSGNVRQIVLGLANWSALSTDLQNDLARRYIHSVMLSSEALALAPDIRFSVALRLRNNIPLRALLYLSDWRTPYQNVCSLSVPDGKITYRSFLHPTRSGIASPDLVDPLLQTRFFAPFTMGVVTLLRFCEMQAHVQPHSDTAHSNGVVAVTSRRNIRAVQYLQTLCSRLNVSTSPSPNFDELCGALQEQPEQVRQLLRALNGSVEVAISDPVEVVEATLGVIEPNPSELYADWEVWARRALLDVLSDENDQRAAELFGKLHHYFCEPAQFPSEETLAPERMAIATDLVNKPPDDDEAAPSDENAPFKIGIWGTSRAGKTTYLAMLYQEFLAQHETWEIFADTMSKAFVLKAREQINELQTFPEKTNERNYYHYDILHKESARQFSLEFLDAPGELYEQYYDTTQRNQRSFIAQRNVQPVETNVTPQELFDYLKSCDGILIFIDPGRNDEQNRPRTNTQLLLSLLEDLRQYRHDQQKEPPHIAFCLTKADGKPETWQTESFDHQQCWLRAGMMNCADCLIFRRLGSDFMTRSLPGLLPLRYKGCFVVSAIGRTDPNHSNVSEGSAWMRPITPVPPGVIIAASGIRPFHFELKMPDDNTFSPNSILDKNDIKPYNLLAPIRWLLNVE